METSAPVVVGEEEIGVLELVSEEVRPDCVCLKVKIVTSRSREDDVQIALGAIKGCDFNPDTKETVDCKTTFTFSLNRMWNDSSADKLDRFATKLGNKIKWLDDQWKSVKKRIRPDNLF